MQIGHTGRTRVEEIILACALLVIAVRTALPIGGPGAYGHLAVKFGFAVLMAVPGVWLLFSRNMVSRKRSLWWVCVTYYYVGALVPIVDWTRFGTAAALFALAAQAGYLYYITAEEIRWTQAQSSRSSPPSVQG
jgi:hypothetical protein